MCIRVVERYALCRCIYYSHAVEACPAFGRRNHAVETEEYLVGHLCPQHSLAKGITSPSVASHDYVVSSDHTPRGDGNESLSPSQRAQSAGYSDIDHANMLLELGMMEAEDAPKMAPAHHKANKNDHISLFKAENDSISTSKPGLDIKSGMKGPRLSSQPCSAAPVLNLYVRALYDYEAGDMTEISFRRGDIIQVVGTDESGWWDGINNGSDGWDGNDHGVRGWFPSNHCTLENYQEQFASASRTEPLISGGEVVDQRNDTQIVTPYVYADFDFEGDSERELSFRRGDAIQVIDQHGTDWWYGISNGVNGWFPANYCTGNIGQPSGSSKAQEDSVRTGTGDNFESSENQYICTESLADAPSNIKPDVGSTLEPVDEHNRQKRLKVMRACKRCKIRKIKCDAAMTNTWPCAACVRLKLHCIPPTMNHDRPPTGNAHFSGLEHVSDFDNSSDSDEDDYGQHMNEPQAFESENPQGQIHVSQTMYNDAPGVVRTSPYPSKAQKRTEPGCLTCRQRRIRCGKEQPNCVNCVKSKRNCDGYAMQFATETQEKSPLFKSPVHACARVTVAQEARITAPRALMVVPKAKLDYITYKASNEFLRQPNESSSMQTSSCADVDSNPFTGFDIFLPQDTTRPSSSTEIGTLRKDPGIYRENPEGQMSTPSGVTTDTSLLMKEIRGGPESPSKGCTPLVTGTSEAKGSYQTAKGVLKLTLCVIGLLLLLYKLESMHINIYDVGMILPLQWQRHSVFESLTFDSFIAKVSQIFSLPLSIAPSMLFVWYCCWSFAGCLLVFLFAPETKLLGLEEMDAIFGRSQRTRWKHNVRHTFTYLSYILEPQLEKGKRRIRWTCRCRHRLYDDFHEVQPGAAERLEQSLKKHSGFRERNSTSQGNAGGSLKSRSSTLNSLLSSTWLPWNSVQNASPSLPLHQKQDESSHHTQTPAPRRPEDLFLLLCIPHRKYATKLVHMDVCTLQSDQIFFAKLKAHYHEMRGRWSSFFSLKTLKSIQFVQFEMYKSELVDIRRTNDIPPETKKDEYRYQPIPAEVIPPVGENHLMHLYDHPEDAEDTGVCLQKIPKKVRERLLVCPNRGTGLGWGIHFVEGLNWTKLWWLGLVGLLTSIAFGVSWSVVKDDIQGGFGVTACMMVVLTFTIGILQAAFEPK